MISQQNQVICLVGKEPFMCQLTFCNIRNITVLWNSACASSQKAGSISKRSMWRKGLGLVDGGEALALVERKSGYTSSLSEAHAAVASNCINEFPGDRNQSCEGCVKLGFRNPSF